MQEAKKTYNDYSRVFLTEQMCFTNKYLQRRLNLITSHYLAHMTLKICQHNINYYLTLIVCQTKNGHNLVFLRKGYNNTKRCVQLRDSVVFTMWLISSIKNKCDSI